MKIATVSRGGLIRAKTRSARSIELSTDGLAADPSLNLTYCQTLEMAQSGSRFGGLNSKALSVQLLKRRDRRCQNSAERKFCPGYAFHPRTRKSLKETLFSNERVKQTSATGLVFILLRLENEPVMLYEAIWTLPVNAG